MDQADVAYQIHAVTNGRRTNRNRQSRALDERQYRVSMLHKPTGAEVQGEIPTGHYSRQELNKFKATLHGSLWLELEREAYRRTRIPGK